MYINKFESSKQVRECAQYYIQLLGLQDWRIVFELGIPKEESSAGECYSIFEEKCAKIIINKNEPSDENYLKQPQELVLIHELIHCKIELYDNDRLEGRILYQIYHTLIDDWARSVFYARYGLTHKDMYLEEEDEVQCDSSST